MKKIYIFILLLLITAPGVWAMGSTKDDPASTEVAENVPSTADPSVSMPGVSSDASEGMESPPMATPEDAQGPMPIPEETAVCAYPELIGKNIKDVDTKAYFPGRAVRVLPPGAMATMDYSPTRLNIHTDEAGVIKMFACG